MSIVANTNLLLDLNSILVSAKKRVIIKELLNIFFIKIQCNFGNQILTNILISSNSWHVCLWHYTSLSFREAAS